MCGIAGIVDFSGKDRGMRKRIRSMADAMAHRGPDDEGYLAFDPTKMKPCVLTGPESRIDGPRVEDFSGRADIFLGHRRLTVLDLSNRGHQPMSNKDGTLWIVHNGEVYNYREIRAELQGLGHKFFSNTDTEVVLKAYEEWSQGCLNRFNGMFAFTILDTKNMRLFSARDRFGIKPFYYIRNKDVFTFASEIKAFVAAGLTVNRPNDTTVYRYLHYGMSDYGDETFFEGVRRLPGGHFLALDLKTGRAAIRKYYDILCFEKSILPDDEYRDKFYEIFEDAVGARLMGDVPSGSCLSGGLDSSSIVCLIDKLLKEGKTDKAGGRAMKTFSACYKKEHCDEARYIDSVIAKTGFTASKTYPAMAGLKEHINDLVYMQDEPFMSTSIYAQWEVFKLSRKAGIKIVLDGQGADEMLGGYDTHMYEFLAQLLKSFRWGSLIRESALRKKRPGLSGAPNLKLIALYSLPPYVRGFLARHARSAENTYYWPKRCILKDVRDESAGFRPEGRIGGLDAALRRSFYKGLPEFLRYEDRNSMAHSVESRLPFLDHRLVEFVFTTPESQKISKGERKVILRRAMNEIIPEAVKNRYDKIGFMTPQDKWLRDEFKESVFEMTHSKNFKAEKYFKHDQLNTALDKYFNGNIELTDFTWRVISLELWMRRFIT